jgi:molecular chaperone GrpE
MPDKDKEHRQRKVPLDDLAGRGSSSQNKGEPKRSAYRVAVDQANKFMGELAETKERCRVAEDDVLRLRAEFDNYRKRTDRERAESANRASVNLIKRLIPVADDLDRAVAAASEDEAAAKFAEGLVLVRAHFMKALEDEGLTEIDAAGQMFDPYLHEAIMQEASDEHEDEHVIEVLRKGYRLGDTVVRPAMVKIARNDG